MICLAGGRRGAQAKQMQGAPPSMRSLAGLEWVISGRLGGGSWQLGAAAGRPADFSSRVQVGLNEFVGPSERLI